MPLVVEDGTGVAGAESYASVDAATAYWVSRPQDANAAAWTAAAGVDGKQEGALREGAAFLDATWGLLYRGSRKTAAQGRPWPRVTRVDLDPARFCSIDDFTAAQALTDQPLFGADGLQLADLPAEIIAANIELAARATIARLAADKDETGWLKSRTVGPIAREWGGPGIPGGSYGFVDGLLAPVLIGIRNAQWTWA